MDPLTFPTVAAWLCENPTIVEKHLTDYFTKNEGRFFEYFIGQSDPFQFTPWDFLAISALSINPRASTMAAVLESEGNHLNIALAAAQKEIRALPAEERSLWAIDAIHLREESTLYKLYYLLRVIPDVGPTTASKLLAAKFTEIVPIRDSKVKLLLQADDDWWIPMREVMRNKELRDELSDVSLPLEGHDPSLLRRLDVVLWMEAASRGF
jgi:hypothetical protein